MIEPDCHIGLVVTIDSTKYWIDVGNGYPYNFPYKLGSGDVIVHPFMNYRVVKGMRHGSLNMSLTILANGKLIRHSRIKKSLIHFLTICMNCIILLKITGHF